MYFSIKRDKEISDKAKELGGYYTSEFATGYMLTYHPLEYFADILMIGPVVLIPILLLANYF